MTTTFSDAVTISGAAKFTSTISGIDRTKLDTITGSAFPIKLTDFRVHDAFATVLPGTSATDDLGLYGGSFGTNSPLIQTYDVKTVGATTLYGRALVQLPYNYVDGSSVSIKCHAGMEGAVADTSCTLDCEVYESDAEGGIGSDLVTTAATTINSLTYADVSYTVTAAGLVAGDWLDLRLAVAVNDGAGGASVQAAIGSVELVCDTKG